jgi:hypothetical protein
MIEVAPGQMAGVKQIMGFIHAKTEFVCEKQAKDGNSGYKQPE